MARQYPLGNSHGRILLRALQNGDIPPGPRRSIPDLFQDLQDRIASHEEHIDERFTRLEASLQDLSGSILNYPDVRIILHDENRPRSTHYNLSLLLVAISLISIFFFRS